MESPIGLPKDVASALRTDVRFFVRLLASPEEQERLWIVVRRVPEEGRFSFWFWVGMLWDTYEIFTHPRWYLGTVILNEAEASALEALAAELNTSIVSVGGDPVDDIHHRAPNWGTVVRLAKALDDEFSKTLE